MIYVEKFIVSASSISTVMMYLGEKFPTIFVFRTTTSVLTCLMPVNESDRNEVLIFHRRIGINEIDRLRRMDDMVELVYTRIHSISCIFHCSRHYPQVATQWGRIGRHLLCIVSHILARIDDVLYRQYIVLFHVLRHFPQM